MNDDLDISQLSAVTLQRMGVTVAQVRAVYATPLKIYPPEETGYTGVYRAVGFLNTGRFLSVALAYVETTGRITALAVQVALDLDDIRDAICRRVS